MPRWLIIIVVKHSEDVYSYGEYLCHIDAESEIFLSALFNTVNIDAHHIDHISYHKIFANHCSVTEEPFEIPFSENRSSLDHNFARFPQIEI